MPRTSRGGLVLAEQERPTGARRLVGALVIVAVIVGLGYAGYAALSSLLAGPKSESCVATAAGQTAELAPDQAGWRPTRPAMPPSSPRSVTPEGSRPGR